MLPAETTSLIGRQAEVGDVHALLSSARLVTLLGPGGVGKTRIALRAAAELADTFSGGVRMMELSALADPKLLPHTVAESLGLPEQSGRSPVEAIVDYLRDSRLLLVLDTCDHVADACAMFAQALLRGAPRLQILATSRQPLNIAEEHLLPITPLPTDGNGSAVTLFAERAAAVSPGFAVTDANRDAVTALCRRLDGIPLAIELAAARLRSIPLEELREHISILDVGHRSAESRHQTMRAAIDWSYDLCSPEERQLWARLSVFAGTFNYTAANAVCADSELASKSIGGYLSGLVDKSVLLWSHSGHEPRYQLLDPLRRYGQERLTLLGQRTAFLARHRDHYLSMAKYFDDRFLTSEQIPLYRRLTVEDANLRAALEFSFGVPGQAVRGLRLTACLWGYWFCSARLTEGRYWSDKGLKLVAEPVAERARVLGLSSWFALSQGVHEPVVPMLEEARRIAESLGDEPLVAYILMHLANARMVQGRYESALGQYEEAHRRFRELGDRPGLVIVCFQLGMLHCVAGDTGRAIELADDSLRHLGGETRECWSQGWAVWVKGLALWIQGQRRESAALTRRALAMKVETRGLLAIANCLETLAWIAIEQGHHPRAGRLLGAAGELWRQIGGRQFGVAALQDHHERAVTAARDALGAEEYHRITAEGARMPLQDVVELAIGDGDEPEGAPKQRPEHPALARLTPREREVAALVAEGLSNREIAERLVIAKRTADAHVEHILAKLEFSSRVQIANLLTS